ncbi:TonB-dependent receptor domain-containing protein [Rheinheimera marina]|uniref:TonB-dependent receptor domain-containing protein n=1 Tax=Rheinheimera marina TaxID=1774958 RepID=A0ABV9JKA0_9GAMM
MVRYSALATAVAMSSFTVLADSGQDPFEHLTVYANRQSAPVAQQLSSVVVLDRQAIEQAQVVDLPALLAQVAGVQISRNGSKGHASSVYIRGGASGHTLVLIDGVRIGAATLGYASLAELPLQQIEQVEVIKGPKAALYGSDAVSGVIAITTRKAEQTQLTVKAGRYGNREADIATSVRSGDLSLSANLGVARADGFDIRPGTQPDEDGYVQRFGKVAAAYQSSVGDWSLDHQRLQQDLQYDADPTWGGTDQADIQTDLTSLGWNYSTGQSQQQLKLSRQKNADLNFGNDSPDSLFQTRRDELDYQYSQSLTNELKALAGVNWYQEDVYGTSYEVDSRINKALFAGLSYQHVGWLLDGTVRHDKQSQYGHQNTYQLAAGYQLTADWQLRLSRATAFKAPSFNDLYYPYSGNPLLQPEHALSHELGLRYSGKSWQLDSSLYQQDVDNLVQWAPDESGNWLPANVGKAKIQGAELSLAQQWQAFSQQLNYSYTDAKDDITDERLIKRSRHTLFWQGAYQWQQWRAFVNSRYQSDFATGDYSTPVQGGFTLWDAGLSWTASQKWEMALKLENLTNKDYQYVPGYAAPGSEWSLQVISRF